MTISMVRARIDKEVMRHRLALSNLHSQLNSYSITFRLPPEILGAIFIHCVRDHYYTYGSTGNVPRWVDISYVCSYWRNVALNCSTLWSYLFAASPRWMEELLARSKRASLKLDIRSGTSCYPYSATHFAEQAMKHPERIQELRIPYLPVEGNDNLLLPRLERLSISRLGSSNYSGVSTTPFVWYAPALRTLDLSFCPVSWHSFKSGHLTRVSLNYVPAKCQQDMKRFLATLSRLRGLTYLHLNDALPSATNFLSSMAFRTFRKFDMPLLTYVLICAPLSTVVALLSCVDIGLEASMTIRVDSRGEDHPDYYARLSSILQQRFSCLENQAYCCRTIRSLSVVFGNENAVPVGTDASPVASESPESALFHPSPVTQPLRISLDPYAAPHGMNGVLRDLCSSVSYSNVQSMSVMTPPFSSTFWRETLKNVPNLRRLSLTGGNMPDLASVLSHDSMAVPLLEELKLKQLVFSAMPLRGKVRGLCDVREFYKAFKLSRRKGTQGQLTISCCVIVKVARRKDFAMIGRWDDGRCYVVQSSYKGIR